MVTFLARTNRLPVTSAASTTVPGVVIVRSPFVVCFGVHPAGTPVLEALGNPAGEVAPGEPGAVGAGAPVLDPRTILKTVRLGLLRRRRRFVATIVAR